MRVIGIDPGLRNMGWGIIQTDGNRMHHIANGACTSPSGDLASRLYALHQQLTAVMQEFQPEAAAVEQTFVNSNGAATLKLGQARGIALLVPAQFGVAVAEYAPNTIKKTVVGVGHAGKDQITHMVKVQLPTASINGADAADALAIALCHVHHAGYSGRLEAALQRARA